MDINAKRTFKMECNKPEFNTTFEFERCKSGAFQYGNQTCVVVTSNGGHHDYLDTRYDEAVMGDFTVWCMEYLHDTIRKDLKPQFTLVESSDE